MRRTAFRRLQTNIPISWLLRDEFSDTRAAGSVNGTMATPGPGGARVVTDTGSRLSIGSGVCATSSGGAYGDPMVHYDPISRAAGLGLFVDCNCSSGAAEFGFKTSSGGTRPVAPGFDVTAGTGVQIWYSNGSNKLTAAALTTSVAWKYAALIRSTGYALFYAPAGVMLLLWVDGSGTSGTLYPCLTGNAFVGNHDFIRCAQTKWLPTPLVSDGFGLSFGTSDGLGHAEGVSGGIGSGGGNVTWTQQVGTWTVSSAKAAAATLSGGVAVATVPLSTKDVLAKVKVTRSAGAGGLTLRWTDSSNYLYAEHDGTNAYLKQVLSGSTTTLITAAATYSAAAEIVADLSGVNGRLYYNNALIGTTSSINSGLTATLHGLRSTDTGGIQLDDLCIYAKGTGGEYNIPLNRYINL